MPGFYTRKDRLFMEGNSEKQRCVIYYRVSGHNRCDVFF